MIWSHSMSIEHNQTKRDEQNTNRIENVEIYDDNKKRILLNFLLRNISTTYSASTAGKIRLTDLNWWLCLSENSWIVFAILFGKFDWLCKPCLENLPKLIEPITQLFFFLKLFNQMVDWLKGTRKIVLRNKAFKYICT